MQSVYRFSLGIVLFVLLHGGTYCDGAYKSGNPGADWSDTQSEIVMEKLLKLMHDPNKAILDIVPEKKRRNKTQCSTTTECKNPALPEVKQILGDEKYLDMIYDATFYENKKQRYSNIWPDMPKFVRLTFHDCVKEGDGRAGCNG